MKNENKKIIERRTYNYIQSKKIPQEKIETNNLQRITKINSPCISYIQNYRGLSDYMNLNNYDITVEPQKHSFVVDWQNEE